MSASRRRRSDRAGRGPIRSPGRPTAGRREHRQAFWKAIARGVSSWEAALDAGVSQPVGTRWFRENGGMPPTNLTPMTRRRDSRSRATRSVGRPELIALTGTIAAGVAPPEGPLQHRPKASEYVFVEGSV